MVSAEELSPGGLATVLGIDITSEQTVQWLNRHVAKNGVDKPFFLYESFTVPHAGGWSYAGSAGHNPEDGAPG